MHFVNKFANKIYKYIYIHDGETLLLKDMEVELGICRKTIAKYIKWLDRRGYIKKTGKRFTIIPQ